MPPSVFRSSSPPLFDPFHSLVSFRREKNEFYPSIKRVVVEKINKGQAREKCKTGFPLRKLTTLTAHSLSLKKKTGDEARAMIRSEPSAICINH
jgi:hypothetical protein